MSPDPKGEPCEVCPCPQHPGVSCACPCAVHDAPPPSPSGPVSPPAQDGGEPFKHHPDCRVSRGGEDCNYSCKPSPVPEPEGEPKAATPKDGTEKAQGALVEAWMLQAAHRIIHGKQEHSVWDGERPQHLPVEACEWTAMTIAEEAPRAAPAEGEPGPQDARALAVFVVEACETHLGLRGDGDVVRGACVECIEKYVIRTVQGYQRGVAAGRAEMRERAAHMTLTMRGVSPTTRPKIGKAIRALPLTDADAPKGGSDGE